MPPPSNARKSYQSAKGGQLDECFEVEIDGTVFKAYPHRVPATALIDFQGMTVTRDPEAMWGFFRHAMPDGVCEEFREFCDSPSHIITADTLGQIITDLVEFTTGRPTEQPSS